MTTDPPATASSATRLNGATLEVRDLDATRRFYGVLLAGHPGSWTETARGLAFDTDSQCIEFVRVARPKPHGNLGQHLGLRVPAGRIQQLIAELGAMSGPAQEWREDHPAERTPTSYVADPSGNLVQVVPADTAPPLDHVTLPVDNLEASDLFYRQVLGGTLDHYHAWRMADVHEARAWASGDDPCAPWTRMTKFSRVSATTTTSAIPQVYLAFGAVRLGLVVSTKHIQEPPEGLLRGTPALRFRSSAPADSVAAHLREVDISTAATVRKVRGVPFERDGATFYLRDPSGYFATLECAG